MKNEKAVEFIFDEYTYVQMNSFYFTLKIMKSIENPPLQNKYAKKVVKCMLLPNQIDNNKLFCTTITNNQITLNRNGDFNINNNLDTNIEEIKFFLSISIINY